MSLDVIEEFKGEDWIAYNADCIEVVKGLPSNSIGLTCTSLPFSNLYCYSDSPRDLGNCKNDAEFFRHYSFLIGELLRITKPGRLCAVHCKDLVDYKGSSGRAGLRDFPGDIIRAHEAAGWKYHSRTTVWKDPVVEMQRTKAHGLLYKQLRADSTFSRMGLAEYVLFFRKWVAEGEDAEPVKHTEATFPLEQWQRWASPVWMDIDQTDVLNVQQARADKDSKHICPLQLDLIERCVRMYSNPGDTVLDPFGGIGSTGVVALQHGRKAVMVELKPEYARVAARNLENARRQLGLFAVLSQAEEEVSKAPSDPAQFAGGTNEGSPARGTATGHVESELSHGSKRLHAAKEPKRSGVFIVDAAGNEVEFTGGEG